MTEIDGLIKDLKRYDNKAGYRQTYNSIAKKLKHTINGLVGYGENCLDELHPLLLCQNTWSCLFALEAIKQIKCESSIPFLIRFIRENEQEEYLEACEEAMAGLIAIGKAAVEPSLDAIKAGFENKVDYGYLVEAVSTIGGEKVRDFMLETITDYADNPKKYKDWFMLIVFVACFADVATADSLPLLRKLVSMDNLDREEKLEIKSVIEHLEDPEEYERKMTRMIRVYEGDEQIDEKALLKEAVELESKKKYDEALAKLHLITLANEKSYHAFFLMARIQRKQGTPNLFCLEEAFKFAKEEQASAEVFELIANEKRLAGL